MDIRLIKEDLGGTAGFYRGGEETCEVQKVRLLDRQQVLEKGVLYLGDLTKARVLSGNWQVERAALCCWQRRRRPSSMCFPWKSFRSVP